MTPSRGRDDDRPTSPLQFHGSRPAPAAPTSTGGSTEAARPAAASTGGDGSDDDPFPPRPERASPDDLLLPRSQRGVGRALTAILVPGERRLVVQHRHPVVLLEPVVSSVAVLVGIGAISDWLGDLNVVRGVLLVGWLVLVGRALLHYWDWMNDWFVVTDRRLLRLHGIVDTKRDMMPLVKVTDMAYERPFWGRLVGYGRFLLESAGQDQALREISFVQDPERTYQTICRQIFVRPPFMADPRE